MKFLDGEFITISKISFQNEKLNMSFKCLLQHFRNSYIDNFNIYLKGKLSCIVLVFILFEYNPFT